MNNRPVNNAAHADHSTHARHSGESRNPVTEYLNIWTAAQETKLTGRGKSTNNQSIYGIKKLRELILELAVRGKLEPQNSNDEPASALLKKIAVEKACLVKAGEIKQQKLLPEITEDDKPFKLTVGWQWVRLGTALNKITDGTHHSPPNGDTGAFLYISAKNIKSEGVMLSNATRVSKKVHDEIYSRCNPEYGDILYIKDGATTGVVTINNLEEPFSMLSSVALLKLPEGVSNKYLLLTLRSPYFYDGMRAGMTGVAITRVTLKKLNNAFLALPPLAEQHRIVAKVDELMTLCDKLEQQQTNSNATHQTLVKTMLATLTHPTTGADGTETNTIEIFFQHFDTLFTTEQSIDHLKQTILQLAVMGELVPQKPNDEPVKKLLKKVAEEKERLTKAGEIKKQKELPEIGSAKNTPNLPEGWQWVFLGSLVSVMDAGWSPACLPKPSPNNDIWGVLKTTAVQVMKYLEIENKTLPGSLDPRPQYEVSTGDILITRAGPKNRVAISCLVQTTRPKLMISDKIIRFHLIDAGIAQRYITLCLNAGVTAEYLENAKSGMAESQMNISQVKLRLAPIALCPIGEQHRIITKVDQLMERCDALKARLTDVRTTQLQLADAIVMQTVS